LRTVGDAVGSVAKLDEIELAAWFGLLQAHALVARRLDTALQERHRLSLVEHTVLRRLRAAGGRMRMSDLAGSALLSPSGVSRLVDRMVVGGMIERTAWREDGRAIYAVITEPGLRLLDDAGVTYASELRECFLDHFSEDDVRTLGELLARLLPASLRS
jgi:DNA-binding MarR family transcriptional regulator